MSPISPRKISNEFLIIGIIKKNQKVNILPKCQTGQKNFALCYRYKCVLPCWRRYRWFFLFGYILDRYSKMNVLALVFHMYFICHIISFRKTRIPYRGRWEHSRTGKKYRERQCTIKSNNHITSTLRCPFQQCKMK